MIATTATPVVRDAEVLACESVAAYRVLRLRAPEVAAGARPGEFVNLDASACLLRRPFSVYLADPEAGEIAIAFDAIGAGTEWLAARAPGDAIDLVGPLGHGFSVPEEPGVDLLVGGGYGAAALAFLARELAARGSDVHGVLGGRTAARVFEDDVLAESCASLAVVTDDGSRGARGIVTDPLPALVGRFAPRTIYACGPMPMLAAVARVAAELGVPCEVAVEEFMACGIGVCWTCVLPVRVDGSLQHLRSCTEGPVFSGEDVVWP